MHSILKRNKVHVSGRGARAVVFAHGFGCTQDDWRQVAPAFERDFQVVRYDLSGCGAFDAGAYDYDKYASLQGHATDLLDVLHDLELPQVHFVGHSAGGMIGVLAAVREPRRFTKLALIGSSPRYIDDAGYVGGAPQHEIDGVLGFLTRDWRGWCDAIVPLATGNQDRPELARDMVRTFKQTDATFAAHFGRAIFYSDFRTALPHCSTPALVLQTAQDIFVPEAVGRYLATHLGRGTLHRLESTGHFPQVAAPEELKAALRTWAN